MSNPAKKLIKVATLVFVGVSSAAVLLLELNFLTDESWRETVYGMGYARGVIENIVLCLVAVALLVWSVLMLYKLLPKKSKVNK